ncbi:hypothetical protein Acy02nite_14230 [Actinoplanes cyaneus]|uniref:Uncharacterized protein n=1 Tax=Actinoplanes cyaneus TaxID=52696 RepID=A0A919IFR2_9ACTN|nr:hypothetical protein Acy02nite_14230 [Actinoplanes cyaneus]
MPSAFAKTSWVSDRADRFSTGLPQARAAAMAFVSSGAGAVQSSAAGAGAAGAAGGAAAATVGRETAGTVAATITSATVAAPRERRLEGDRKRA